MAQVASVISVDANSPRSTLLPSPSDRSTPPAVVMNGSNAAADGGTGVTMGKGDAVAVEGPEGGIPAEGGKEATSTEQKESKEPESPSQRHAYSQFKLQPQMGYSPVAYPPQVTPAPPSPAGGAVLTDGYGSFFHPPSAGAFMPHSNAFGGHHQSPLSPPRPTTAVAAMPGGVPPNSPLFPRLNGPPSVLHPGSLDGSHGLQQPPSPTLAYSAMGGMYPSYASATLGGSVQGTNSMEESGSATPGGWVDGFAPNQYGQHSPQLSAAGGMPMPYGMSMGRGNARNPSFDEGSGMLPPSVMDVQDPSNPNFSPYSQTSSNGLVSQHQPWQYMSMPEMYNNQQVSPLQPRPTHQMPMGYPMAQQMQQMRPMNPYGAYFPACSPGPPIQTTATNKGPQGSNLFVFHIPNNMTNGDMYQLFSQYGHLISVRIMVEKDTGRSRGFGFVSFDNPDSAALAIKELNGYAIGNKRLKVQHKQIRPKDIQQDREDGMHGYGMGQSEGGGYDRSQYGASLPPSGAGAASNGWFAGPGDDMPGVPPKGPDDVTEQTSTSTNGETPLNLSGEAALGASPLASLGTLQAALPET